ncbi:MAG TPA: TonB family protein [Polyangia bacterium]|nr:TonB family protein [Polyangia bacterium]
MLPFVPFEKPSVRSPFRISVLGLALLALPARAFAQASADAPAARRVQPPVVVEEKRPPYPADGGGARGDVAVTATIGPSGDVSAVELTGGVAAALDRAALQAAMGWRFKPAQRDGVPVAARVQLLFHFEPPAEQPAVPAAAAPNAAPAAAGGPPPIAVPLPAAPPPAVEPAPPQAGKAPAALDVMVVGRRPPPSRGASDFQIRVGQLAEVPRANASDLLRLAPGILLTNEGGEGHAEQVYMRGFDAREGQDVEFSVGGVPINESGNLHGNGYADTHFIIPELIESLRVVEGPFDPRQGNFAVAGSADYELGLEQRGLSASATVGSWGTRRVLGLFGPPGESTHTFGGAEVYATDGFGQNRDAQRGSAMGQYEGHFGATGSWRLTGQAYASHFHSAGVIRDEDYRSGRIGFYDSYDLTTFAHEAVREGGDASRYSIAADLEAHPGDTVLTQQVFLIKRDMRLLENFTGFLLDVQEPLQSIHPQRGDMLDLNVHELTAGARGSARWHGPWLGQRQELELGYFARGDAAAGTQQRLEAATGVPYLTETNLDSQIGDIGLYGDLNLRPVSWLSLRGGARADVLTYQVLDNCASHSVSRPSPTNPPIDQSCLTQQDLGRPREPDQVTSTSGLAILPRASLLVGPFRGVTLSASYGQGVRSVDPSYITQDITAPFAHVTAYEAGVAYTRSLWNTLLVARSVLFQTVVDKDLIFDQTVGRNVIGVGTTRSGWLGALRWTGAFFDESANLTLVRATYNDTDAAVPYVPASVLRSDTSLFTSLPWALRGAPLRASLGAGITYVGRRPLPYGQVSDDILTIDASATLAWRNVQVRVLSTNLLDSQYRLGEYNYESDFKSQPQPTLVPDRTFTAGPPRGLFLTLGVTFGGV